MQTPEAIARAFIERTRLPPGVRGLFEDELTGLLRAYGDERAHAERERCHALALSSVVNSMELGDGWDDTAAQIAAAIRAAAV